MKDDHGQRGPERLDFSPLDPRGDAARFERLVREIRRTATPELVRRQGSLTLIAEIARWRRPILATSGALALAAAVVAVAIRPSPAKHPTVAEALGAPSDVARWLQGSDRPTTEEFLGLEESQP